ncbi:MAG: hypothetical protein J5I90_19935 [Caldilineales bacterium]|nr:hypothetical protein [Caldilineales bacterium]
MLLRINLSRIFLISAVIFSALWLLSGCGGGGDKAAPTPAGQPLGKSTLLFFWSFP